MPRQMATAQGELPKLPVPPLRQTLTKFLAFAKPLVSTDEFKETEKVCYILYLGWANKKFVFVKS